MPKVHFVKKARKARRKYGIKRGDSYYWWKTRMKGSKREGVIHYSRTKPKQSQLTMSPFKSEFYAIVEDLEELSHGEHTGYGEVVGDLNDLSGRMEELQSQEQDKFDNMPESLQSSSTGDMIQARIDACVQAKDAIDNAASDLEALDDSSEDLADEISDILVGLHEGIEVPD